MSIRIVRNESANCITFEGTTVPAYFNSCLSGEVSSHDPDRVNVKNDIRSNNQIDNFYEFSNIHYTEFEDRDGNTFKSAQECADYITSQGNVLGVNEVGKDLANTTVNFRLDETSTSIIMDNGEAFGVNTIKAVPDGGLIKIKSIGEGVPTGDEEPVDRVYFENLDHTLVKIKGSFVTGGLNDVVDKLNELFTVGAFEAVVIRDPYSTMVADVNGVDAEYTLEGTTAIDPTGDDIFTNSTSGNYAGLKSTATINQAGEYFTFDIRGEGQIGFGLIHTQSSYDDGYYSGNANYADPTTFAVGNSAHYGFQFSHWFHPTPNGSWTNYGANTAYSVRPGWSNWESQDDWIAGDPVKIKVGIDENRFIAISSLQDDNTTWIVHARTTYPVSQGSEFHLGIKAANSAPRVFTAPKVHLLEVDDTPTVIGDSDIDVFGTATGTLAGGVTVSSANGNNDGFITAEILSAAGQYFEFEVNENEDHIIGLFSENDYDVSTVQADIADWNKGKYMFLGGIINTAEQLSTNIYKNGSGASMSSTLLNRPTGCTHFRIGFDTQGRATLWSSTDGVNFVASIRHTSAAPTGDYKLMWVADTNGATFESLTSGQLSSAPIMNFRYIESPDGIFQFPLFATLEEANYYIEQNGGTAGSGTSQIFPDDPTFSTWYLPYPYYNPDEPAAPVGEFFLGNFVTTEPSSIVLSSIRAVELALCAKPVIAVITGAVRLLTTKVNVPSTEP